MSRHSGRHELGQNFLTDRATIARIVDLVARTDGPIVEIGPGAGAVTLPLETLGRQITAVELDGRLVAGLRNTVGRPRSADQRGQPPRTRVVHADFGGFALPRAPHVIVGNLPFHRTTGMLRRVLAADHWTDAVLLVQWEVARRRAGVGGATMMTAQRWPWFEFGLDRRVPASAFTPRPDVDGGLLTISRRARPLVPASERRGYTELVHAVFTGPGRGIREILTRRFGDRAAVNRWLADNGVRATALPRELSAQQWAALHGLAAELPARRPGDGRRSGGRTRPQRR
ncbi:23S ribosomal RNA methyltransferase Erm [Prauserella alba]|uniref:Ribosomal RNA adenine methylase transferase N-terminal domain-containing protein n=1 Tax=Prauserella alba TaxID=176898 RepID=A0ABN1VC41_9PSEU|nr:23S ribosomal RNA methyltransferase Erm [Prauserella alba]MCP2178994.1 23S rRNA (adenine-N6)-dimethyltransferase [Prauserella alba]